MQATYKVAMAAGADAANKQMRAAGRTAWSDADYVLCCEVVAQLMGQS